LLLCFNKNMILTLTRLKYFYVLIFDLNPEIHSFLMRTYSYSY
jgi:hypothetical protein